MSWLSRKAKQIDKGRRDVQNVLTGGASDRVGKALGDIGVPTSTRDLIDRSIGSRNRGAVGFSPTRGGKARPKLPTRNLDCAGSGSAIAGIPYAFTPMINLAAGAQAINTDLGDLLNAASSSEVTTDNLMPWDYVAEAMQLIVGINQNVTLSTENLAAMLGQWVLIHREHTQEVWRHPLTKFNPMVAYSGSLGTTFATGSGFKFDYDPVEFEEPIVLLEGKEYYFELRNMGAAFTSVNVIQIAAAFEGYRV